METARILRQKNEKMVLIFVTAVEEYVFQAFDVAAFHYLVKPFSDEKFEEVVKRAVRSIKEYSENQLDEKYMMVQSRGSHMKVFLKDIATVYKGNIIKNLIMDCQSYTKYRPNETTGGIFVSWRRKEELPTGA